MGTAYRPIEAEVIIIIISISIKIVHKVHK